VQRAARQQERSSIEIAKRLASEKTRKGLADISDKTPEGEMNFAVLSPAQGRLRKRKVRKRRPVFIFGLFLKKRPLPVK
jgi:hypothetical protein